MKDMVKYYKILCILIPVYLAIGFVFERDDIFNYFNAVLVVFWIIMIFAWIKFGKSGKTFRKK